MTTSDQFTTTVDDPIGTSTGEQKHPLAEAGEEATQRVGHLAERAADLGLQQADKGRQTAAEGVESVAQTIRRVSTDMQESQPQIANVALTAADQAEQFAQYLRQTDARQMLSSVEDVARRQPLLFIGGGFLLGMAVSRFIKAAGGSSSQGQTGQLGYESGYATGYQSGGSTDYRTSNAYEATDSTLGAGNGNEGI
jgi:hypothetical protein